jgi:hypothetical protein
MPQYTSKVEMQRLFSACGVNYRMDDADDPEDTLAFFIDDASSTVDMYAGQIYNQSDLNTSQWVRIRATWLACYLLSQRMGNPSLFFNRYDQILQELQKVQQQQLPIPGLATSVDMVPTMSNLEHDPRYREKTLRVESEVSTGATSSKQDLSNQLLPEWLW